MFNEITIVGRLGDDPKMSYTQTGLAIANISVATKSFSYNKETKQKTESTEWHSVVFFGKQADNINAYLKRGSLVFIKGSMTYSKYVDKQGVERTKAQIKGGETHFLDKPQQENMIQQQQPQQQAPRQPQPYQQQMHRAQAQQYQSQPPRAPQSNGYYQSPPAPAIEYDQVPF